MITEWTPPDNLDAAHVQRRVLVAEIQEIQNQLGDRERRAELSQEEWLTWRKRAIWALTNRLQVLRQLKDWIDAQSPRLSIAEQRADIVDLRGPTRVIAALLREYVGEHPELDDCAFAVAHDGLHLTPVDTEGRLWAARIAPTPDEEEQRALHH